MSQVSTHTLVSIGLDDCYLTSLLFLDSDIRKVKYRGKHNDKEEDIHLVEFVDSHIEYNKIQGWHEMGSDENKTVGFSGVINGKTVQSIGNIDILYRCDLNEHTFSVSFINRMNNQSMSVHKFEKAKFIVEFGSPNGVDHVLSFKTIEIAMELAVLNTDITRISEDIALQARRTFVNCVAAYESKARHIKLSEQAWKLNKFRNKNVVFDGPNGERQTGILNVILPPGGTKCLITPDEDKERRITLPTERLWIV